MATASSAMNDHRSLSPISDTRSDSQFRPAPVELDAHCQVTPPLSTPQRFALLCGVVEAVGRDGLRPFDPAFVMGMARTDQIDGFRAGIAANTCELSLVFCRSFPLLTPSLS